MVAMTTPAVVVPAKGDLARCSGFKIECEPGGCLAVLNIEKTLMLCHELMR